MKEPKSEFDNFSADYEWWLTDPLRDRFSGGGQEFFHVRKRDLILDFFRRHRIDPRPLSYLDVGCGNGRLGRLLQSSFARVAGCDPSAGMLAASEIEVRLQHSTTLPYADAEFDFVTAVCVYHHVGPEARAALTAEIRRVLRPGGICAIIEHNPFNPVTQLIVRRTPIDEEAILLRPRETRRLLQDAGFSIKEQSYFLYLPGGVYRKFPKLESPLRKFPLGGQYAVFAQIQ